MIARGRPALIKKLQDIIDRAELYATNPTKSFENAAVAFYNQCGFLAPGKDEPMEFGTSVEREHHRREAWDKWTSERQAADRQTLREALAWLLAVEAFADAMRTYDSNRGSDIHWALMRDAEDALLGGRGV